jgi:hypothetical protein
MCLCYYPCGGNWVQCSPQMEGNEKTEVKEMSFPFVELSCISIHWEKRLILVQCGLTTCHIIPKEVHMSPPRPMILSLWRKFSLQQKVVLTALAKFPVGTSNHHSKLSYTKGRVHGCWAMKIVESRGVQDMSRPWHWSQRNNASAWMSSLHKALTLSFLL